MFDQHKIFRLFVCFHSFSDNDKHSRRKHTHERTQMANEGKTAIASWIFQNSILSVAPHTACRLTDSCESGPERVECLCQSICEHIREMCAQARIANDYWILWVNLSLPKCTRCNYWLTVWKWRNGWRVDWPGHWFDEKKTLFWIFFKLKFICLIIPKILFCNLLQNLQTIPSQFSESSEMGWNFQFNWDSNAIPPPTSPRSLCQPFFIAAAAWKFPQMSFISLPILPFHDITGQSKCLLYHKKQQQLVNYGLRNDVKLNKSDFFQSLACDGWGNCRKSAVKWKIQTQTKPAMRNSLLSHNFNRFLIIQLCTAATDGCQAGRHVTVCVCECVYIRQLLDAINFLCRCLFDMQSLRGSFFTVGLCFMQTPKCNQNQPIWIFNFIFFSCFACWLCCFCFFAKSGKAPHVGWVFIFIMCAYTIWCTV